MDYKLHLIRAENLFGKLTNFEDLSDFEKCIILLRQQSFTYTQIQKWLGNPSKKDIRAILIKHCPELIEIDANRNKLQVQDEFSQEEKRLIGLLIKNNQYNYDLEEFGEIHFFIDNKHLFMIDDFKNTTKFNTYDERTRKSILYEIAKELNIDIKTNEFK